MKQASNQTSFARQGMIHFGVCAVGAWSHQGHDCFQLEDFFSDIECWRPPRHLTARKWHAELLSRYWAAPATVMPHLEPLDPFGCTTKVVCTSHIGRPLCTNKHADFAPTDLTGSYIGIPTAEP